MASTNHIMHFYRRMLSHAAYRRDELKRYLESRAETVFLSRIVGPGDLVFDIGANVGTKTAIYRRLGARVVAVEPQSNCLAQLQRKFSHDSKVAIEPFAVSSEPGTTEIFICDKDSRMSSVNKDWVEDAKSGRLPGHEWSTCEEVAVTTLDELVQEHGCPHFIKVDVEGNEREVLVGSTASPSWIAFELTSSIPDVALDCIEALSARGNYVWNRTEIHGVPKFEWSEWLEEPRALATLKEEISGGMLKADVFGRLAG